MWDIAGDAITRVKYVQRNIKISRVKGFFFLKKNTELGFLYLKWVKSLKMLTHSAPPLVMRWIAPAPRRSRSFSWRFYSVSGASSGLLVTLCILCRKIRIQTPLLFACALLVFVSHVVARVCADFCVLFMGTLSSALARRKVAAVQKEEEQDTDQRRALSTPHSGHTEGHITIETKIPTEQEQGKWTLTWQLGFNRPTCIERVREREGLSGKGSRRLVESDIQNIV